MYLLTYISSPKEMGEQVHFEFYIHDVMKSEPNFDTSKCFKNKFVYLFDCFLDFCPYEVYQPREVADDGCILSEAKKEKMFLEWKNLVKVNLACRAALIVLIKKYLVEGDFLEMYSINWGEGTPDILPEPQHTMMLSIDELQESRDFVLKDGHKFIIYR